MTIEESIEAAKSAAETAATLATGLPVRSLVEISEAEMAAVMAAKKIKDDIDAAKSWVPLAVAGVGVSLAIFLARRSKRKVRR